MSPVVQKLEDVAVEDSAYHNGKTRNSSSAVPLFSPPLAAKQKTPSTSDQESYKPLAYNPAAPPAPEPIKHREKTPPPAEAETEGTGLSAAASTSTQLQGPSGATSPQNFFNAPPRDPNAYHTGANKPLDSPSAQILGNSYVGPPPQPLQHLQPQYADYLANRPQHQHAPLGQAQDPASGYSSYSQAPSHSHHHHSHQHGSDYDVHNQLYRPTEQEAHRHKHHRPSDAGQSSDRLEQGAGKFDKGVNKFFKKLEKRIG
ncbi:MAG: hypothetical protein Q9182_007057 [Xanthomendoza sp. 2 TL-2023]